jgi:hypothetical protein
MQKLGVSQKGLMSSSAQRGEQVSRARVVTKRFAHMGEAVSVAWTKNKAATKLERVFTEAMLAHADGFGAFASPHVIAANQVEQVGFFQCDGGVGFPLVINQKGKADSSLLAEMPGVAHITQAHGYQFGASLAELLFVLAQPRDVLTAEDSTIVTQEDDHRR